MNDEIKKITLEKIIVRWMYESLSRQPYQGPALFRQENLQYVFLADRDFFNQVENSLENYKKIDNPIFQNTQDIMDAFNRSVQKGYFSRIFPPIGFGENEHYLTPCGRQVALANDNNKIWQDYINYYKNLLRHKIKLFFLRLFRIIFFSIKFLWRHLLQLLDAIKPNTIKLG